MVNKKGKYIENNLAEMLVLVGGAMFYLERQNNLNGYDVFYLENREKEGFHYRMQKYADKIIISELRKKRVRCSRWKVKQFYRYKEKGCTKADCKLYDYFKYILDYILNEDVLTGLMFRHILNECECEERNESRHCLNRILAWQYKRLVKLQTDLLEVKRHRTAKDQAQDILNKFYAYPRFESFRMSCKRFRA